MQIQSPQFSYGLKTVNGGKYRPTIDKKVAALSTIFIMQMEIENYTHMQRRVNRVGEDRGSR